MLSEDIHICLVSRRAALQRDVEASFLNNARHACIQCQSWEYMPWHFERTSAPSPTVFVLNAPPSLEQLQMTLAECRQRPHTAVLVILADNEDIAKNDVLKLGATEVICERDLGNIDWSEFLQSLLSSELVREHLATSNDVYHDVFRLSPQPMWFYDLETLRFIEVNIAAIRHYGYSREEFLSMTLRDIRPQEDQPLLDEALNLARKKELFFFRGIFRHMKKDGTIIHVEIRSNSIMVEGRRTEVVMASDITDRLAYVDAIAQQNERLREIAVMQSHAVRAPLSRLMAISDRMAKVEAHTDEGKALLEMLQASAKELDDVIRKIVSKTNEQF